PAHRPATWCARYCCARTDEESRGNKTHKKRAARSSSIGRAASHLDRGRNARQCVGDASTFFKPVGSFTSTRIACGPVADNRRVYGSLPAGGTGTLALYLSFLLGLLAGFSMNCFRGARRSRHAGRLGGARCSSLGKADTRLITIDELDAGSLKCPL